MSGASDKARFYLEQYVPELQEYERKGIFTREEVTAIASQRSDFEHTLNARGPKPSDYARYATYEMNLDSLRKKRCKRLGVKSTTTKFSGQRTVFFILERATKKFPGNMGLWMQYINFCQQQKANKKLAKVFTKVLRLKPRDSGLWVLAAKHYADQQGDMGTARSYMQRGLRFCKDDSKLWLEHARLEMGYLTKIAARRKILQLDEARSTELAQEDDDENMIMLPTVTSEDVESVVNKDAEEVDTDALAKLAAAPVFAGGIPIAIFDAAMKQFNSKPDIASEFFDLVFSFDQVPAATKILQHILAHMRDVAPDSADTIVSEAKIYLVGVEAEAVEFPAALGNFLATVSSGWSRVLEKSHSHLAEKVILMLLPYTRVSTELDEDVVKVLDASTKRYIRLLAESWSGRGSGQKIASVAALLDRFDKEGREDDAQTLRNYCELMSLS